MSKDNLKHLPRPSQAFPRKFLSDDFDPSSADQLRIHLEELSSRAIDSIDSLESWIMDLSELFAVVQEEESRLYINMTCFTDDKDNAKGFSEYVEKIAPLLSKSSQDFRVKLTSSDHKEALSPYYGNYLKSAINQMELFDEKNIELQKKISLEVQEYQQVTGSMSVQFQGEEKTLPQMTAFLESEDRSIREEAWKKIAARRLQDKEVLDTHFDKLFSMRNQVAKNAGHDSFVSYIFKAKERYDYTPDDCRTFHQTIEDLVVPVVKELNAKRQKELGLETLRPWDLACDPSGKPPLKPCTTSDEMTEKCAGIFNELDSELGGQFENMRELKLLDLDSRIGKAPGGYQCSLDEYRLPFIFMNSACTNSDLFTLLHESGHSFHQFAMADLSLVDYRDIPSEFAEVASMSMELIGMDFLDQFYNEEGIERAKEEQWESVLRLLPWVAIVDAFQLWLYEHPDHTREERNEYWLHLNKRFGTGVDWSGLDEELTWNWHRQLHIFEVPFYYIEYGFAQLGALQLWKNYRVNKEKAIQEYKAGLALGSSKSLPELFETAGIRFDFSSETVRPLMEMTAKELN